MTQKEYINSLKSTISYLYEKEGRSKSYISRLLNIDRKTLIGSIHDWNMVQANVSHLTPSNQKFANRNKQMIKSRLDQDISISAIARELGVSRDYLYQIINKTSVLSTAREDYSNRLHRNAEARRERKMAQSSFDYDVTDLPDEVWKEILGHNGFFVSNCGRIKSYKKRYDAYIILKQHPNQKNGRMYVTIDNQNLQVARLVGFAFVSGYSEACSTIDHMDNNVANNRADNLRWVSQSENNLAAYQRGRNVARGYSRNGRFRKILLDDVYEFKTIAALAKFLHVSETQASRYISGECRCEGHILNLIY